MNSSYGERSGRRPSGSGSTRPCRGAARAAARRVLPGAAGTSAHLPAPRSPGQAVPGSRRRTAASPGLSRLRRVPQPQLPLRASTAFAAGKPRTTPHTPPPRAPPPGAAGTCPGAARNAPAREAPPPPPPPAAGQGEPGLRHGRGVTC